MLTLRIYDKLTIKLAKACLFGGTFCDYTILGIDWNHTGSVISPARVNQLSRKF